MHTHSEFEVDGKEALRRRDDLETRFVEKAPAFARNSISGTLTRLTGLAPTARADRPVWKDSARREGAFLLTVLIVGLALLALGCVVLKLLGCLCIISAARNLTSGTGHQISHDPAKLFMPSEKDGKEAPSTDRESPARTKENVRRYKNRASLAYAAVSAGLCLPTMEQYFKAHREHHLHVSGAMDPDTRFLASLPVKLDGLAPLLRTLASPTVHFRFARARAAAMAEAPVWRWPVALGPLVGLWLCTPLAGGLWLGTISIGYQVVALLAFCTLHHWAPEVHGRPTEIAHDITLGRLLLPEPTLYGLLRLIAGAVFAAVAWPTDRSHDVHHAAKENGRWYSVQYVRTRLLMQGVDLRQTISTRGMFQAAFKAAKQHGRLEVNQTTLDPHAFVGM